MALIPQIDNQFELKQTEKLIPSKTYKLMQSINTTQKKLKEPIVLEGNELNIDDVGELKGSVSILGSSYQKTRSGKNIVDINSRVCSNISVAEIKGSTITLTQPNTGGLSRCVISLVLQPNTQYILTAKAKVIKNTSTGASIIGIRTGSGNGSWIRSATLNISSTEEQSFELLFDSGEYTNPYLWLYVNSLNTEETEIERIIEYSEVMVRLASTDNTYEEYGVMTSPDYPSEIKSIGDGLGDCFIIRMKNNLNFCTKICVFIWSMNAIFLIAIAAF